jgi:magnesium-transporting ATPase (P-type)
MLFEGVKLLVTNWRLTLIQVLPAMWIWLAMLDLKVHVLRGKSLRELTGPIVIPLVLAVAVVTAASFFLNAVFAFAIVGPGRPEIRPAFTRARSHLAVVLSWGFAVGVALGLSTMVFTRWGRLWFGLSLSIVIGVMMVCYVAVPARLIGVKNTYSKRDKLTASAVGGAIGAVVCTPPYVLGRTGVVMLGWSRTFFFLGCVLIAIGFTLQAGATGAVKAVKMSAKLVGAHRPAPGDNGPASDAPRPLAG